jgi:ATP-dependent Clp endopeptidase proteolytic subunit ClpP
MAREGLKDTISDFHDEGICFETKTIKIFGHIDSSMKDRTISNLHVLDQMSGEVTILLSSDGGDVNEGLAIIDAIRAMKNNVRIIAYGGVESMASVIFQSADEGCRFMMPNSYLMLHHGTSGVVADNPDSKIQWEKLQKYQDNKCIDIYLGKIKEKKPRFTREKLLTELKKDWIIFPKEAIELGLADSILEVY